MRLKSVFIFLLFAFVIPTVYAVQFERTEIPLSLGKHFQFLEDKQGLLSIEDITSSKISDGFIDNHTNILNRGFSESVFWIRFRVTNKLSADDRLLLEIGFPQLQHITLFIPQPDGTFLEKKAGYTIPFESRDIKYHNFIFELPPFEENTYYLRFKFKFAAQVFINLWTHSAFSEYLAKERLLIGLLYGVMVAMILYNFSIFIFTKDISYAYYVAFIFCVTILLLVMNGLINYIVPFPMARWLTHRIPIWIGIAIFLGALFIRKIIGIKEDFPRYSKILVTLGLSGIFVALFSIFTSNLLSVVLTFLAAIIGTGIVFLGIILGCLKKKRIASISIIAFLPIIISNIIAASGFSGLISVNLFSNNVILMGTSLSAIIFSVGLADFINQIKREREQYASDLKRKNIKLLEEISERKQVETHLADSEKKYRGIFKNTQTPYLEISYDGIINEISPSIEKFTMYRREELMGKPINQLLSDNDQRKKLLRKLQLHNELDNEEIELLDKNGTIIHCLVSSKLMPVERVVVGSLMDITERKKAGEALLNYKVQLEQLVKDRTAELEGANQRLVQEFDDRKKMEEQLNQSQKMEAIGTLAGGIAHDFNNILATMMGYSELLISNFADDSVEKVYLNEVYQAGERAADLVSQILTFSRLEETELKAVPFVPLLNKIVSMIRATLPSTIDIQKKINAKEDVRILANTTQMHQVIINICTNAAHAMRDKNGILEFQLSEVQHQENQDNALLLATGSYLKLSIQDTGHGISTEFKERIFDPFFTTKGVGEGTGLGLSIVHGIMESHNAKIFVESEQGIGTTFHLYFPMVTNSETEKEIPETSGIEGTEHILVAEDEISLARLYEASLTRMGYRVTLAFNGAEALEKFLSQPNQFDLIFSDQIMPKMTGSELSRNVLKIRPNMPIILATGYDASRSEEDVKSLKIVSYLRKPVKTAKLTQLIRETLNAVGSKS